MLEQPLVLRVQPGGLRRHLVHDSHVGHQIVIQQILHEITSDETTSCANDKGPLVSRHGLIALPPPRTAFGMHIHAYICMYIARYSPPRMITFGFLSQLGVAMAACHLIVRLLLSSLKCNVSEEKKERKNKKNRGRLPDRSMALLRTHRTRAAGPTALQLTSNSRWMAA